MPALEQALGQHLREPSSHRVSSDISPPAPSMLSAATNLIDRGDEVLGSLQQLSLRLGISGSTLPLLWSSGGSSSSTSGVLRKYLSTSRVSEAPP